MLMNKSRSNLATYRKNSDFLSKLCDISEFGHNCPVVEVDEFQHSSAEADCSSKIVGQRGERELVSDLLLPFAREVAAIVSMFERTDDGRWFAGGAFAWECHAG